MPLSTNEQTNKTASELVETMRGAFSTPPQFRPAHARGILLQGTFTPTPIARELSSAEHFTAPSTSVIVRFSNSTGLPQIPDNASDANPHGMAVRFLLSDDAQTGRRRHTDIIAHSTPYFPVRTGEMFLDLLHAIGASSKPDAPKNPSPIEEYLSKTPSAATFVNALKPTPASFATEKYFGVNAIKLVAADGKPTFVRYRIVPDAGVSHLSADEAAAKDPAFLHNEIQTRVIDGGASFTLTAQVAEPEDPTDDATVLWPEERRVVNLGTIRVDGVVEDNDEKQRTIIFDPVPRIKGVEPSDDPLLDMRAAVYLISGKQRREAGGYH
ncbi:hypothetical protein HRR83_004780 [Exophiala dermatitidis]|nr:hypothetical protein HRR83_004780 [Exophiala dermatitidis]